MTLSQLAVHLGAQVDPGLADPLITRVSSIAAAEPGCLVFAEEEVSFAAALASSAAAVSVLGTGVGPERQQAGSTRSSATAGLRPGGSVAARRTALSVHPRYGCGCAWARLAEDVSIGPQAVIEEGASIGPATTIGSGAVIGAGVSVGSHCRIYPRVSSLTLASPWAIGW